jgi:hypothetical protein
VEPSDRRFLDDGRCVADGDRQGVNHDDVRFGSALFVDDDLARAGLADRLAHREDVRLGRVADLSDGHDLDHGLVLGILGEGREWREKKK